LVVEGPDIEEPGATASWSRLRRGRVRGGGDDGSNKATNEGVEKRKIVLLPYFT
jgi:hypothetical protein